jgi:hypothetical protein
MELHLQPSQRDDLPQTALPPPIESWRRRSAMGAILTGIAMGLKEALEPQRDEPGVVIQVSGEPVDDLPVEAHVDDQRPRESVVTIRPWLLQDAPEEPPDHPADRRQP